MKKLRGSRGVTLTETLCTVLIVLLISAMLAVGVRFAVRTYRESMELSETELLCSTLTAAISDKLRYCGSVEESEEGGVSKIFIQNVGSVAEKGDTFQVDEDGHVTLGGKKLLSASAYPRGLKAKEVTLTYNRNTDIFGVTIQITDGSRVLAETEFEVKRLNG